jgi:hypothetical protein
MMITRQYNKLVAGSLIFSLLLLFLSSFVVTAENDSPDLRYYDLEILTLQDGTRLDKLIINGPPKPPPGFEEERRPVDPAALQNVEASNIIAGVPAFDWSMGCTATSAAMIAGYYDRNSYPNMYTGPANSGVVPLDNSIWGTWTDSYGDTYGQTPLSATRQGLDGRGIKGHTDDYWVQYGSTANDPFYGNWTEHTYGDCTGDYMKTNQTNNYGNSDGSTTIYSFTSNPGQLTCSFMESQGIDDEDGTYGWKLFYESRGYSVTTCYNQKTDNQLSGGFSFEDYKAEIDAGFPVMLHVIGHTMVGVGYDDTGSTVYLHDTWDYSTHQMTWGGSYGGMTMNSVSIIHLEPVELQAPLLQSIDNSDHDGEYLVDWTDIPNAITYTLRVDDNGSFTSPTQVYSGTISEHLVTGKSNGTYFYQVKAENETQESLWSNTESTYVGFYPVFIPMVTTNTSSNGDGWEDIFTDDFEGTFPGEWELWEGGIGEFHWGKRNCLAYEGSYSLWGVGGGTDGSVLPCGSNYPNDAYSWVIYGPFSLETAQEAELNFMYWLNSEEIFDELFWGASTDDINYNGEFFTGNSGGWTSHSFDLTNVYELGDLTGEPQVWIAFVFSSDYSVTEANGAFIDNVVLRKCDSNCGTAGSQPVNTPTKVNRKILTLNR